MQKQNILKNLLALFYPRVCPLCERILLPEEKYICADCAKKLPWVREPFCHKCGKPIANPVKEKCPDCERTEHLYLQGRAIYIYEKGMRHAVDRLKFYNQRYTVSFFGASLAMGSRSFLPAWGLKCVIPVPMHPKKKAARGYDQAALLAEEFSRLTGIPCREDILVRTKYTKASKRLGRENRRRNMRGAFSVRPGALIPEPVLLMDDIYTTGVTMDEASRALRKAGVTQIFFLTLCIVRGADT